MLCKCCSKVFRSKYNLLFFIHLELWIGYRFFSPEKYYNNLINLMLSQPSSLSRCIAIGETGGRDRWDSLCDSTVPLPSNVLVTGIVIIQLILSLAWGFLFDMSKEKQRNTKRSPKWLLLAVIQSNTQVRLTRKELQSRIIISTSSTFAVSSNL